MRNDAPQRSNYSVKPFLLPGLNLRFSIKQIAVFIANFKI